MENMNNILVYGTTTGKKYHFSMKCSYIKGKKYETLKIKEAKFKYEGACSRCKNQNNRKNSPIINNNDNLNIKKNKNIIFFKMNSFILFFFCFNRGFTCSSSKLILLL